MYSEISECKRSTTNKNLAIFLIDFYDMEMETIHDFDGFSLELREALLKRNVLVLLLPLPLLLGLALALFGFLVKSIVKSAYKAAVYPRWSLASINFLPTVVQPSAA